MQEMMRYFPEWKAEQLHLYVFFEMIVFKVMYVEFTHVVKGLAMLEELHQLPWMD